MTVAPPLVADLESRWHSLHDLDRAQAVKSIHPGSVVLSELLPIIVDPSFTSRSGATRRLFACSSGTVEYARSCPSGQDGRDPPHSPPPRGDCVDRKSTR